MIGPTGVGKTEISRRLAKLARAPFLKVEATKFTEVGYVGRDVEQIVRDLMDAAIVQTRERMREDVTRPRPRGRRGAGHHRAGRRRTRASGTREAFRRKLKAGRARRHRDRARGRRHLEPDAASRSRASPAGDGLNLRRPLRQGLRGRTTRKRLTVADSYELLLAEEADKLLDDEAVKAEALRAVEEDGIVFLDEIDKVAARAETRGADVSREGVQRDLLPLIEGTTVSTKHGPVKTDHILFIASGAFHIAKPSDLLPELQGRLPIRVELQRADRGRLRPHPDRDRQRADAASTRR